MSNRQPRNVSTSRRWFRPQGMHPYVQGFDPREAELGTVGTYLQLDQDGRQLMLPDAAEERSEVKNRQFGPSVFTNDGRLAHVQDRAMSNSFAIDQYAHQPHDAPSSNTNNATSEEQTHSIPTRNPPSQTSPITWTTTGGAGWTADYSSKHLREHGRTGSAFCKCVWVVQGGKRVLEHERGCPVFEHQTGGAEDEDEQNGQQEDHDDDGWVGGEVGDSGPEGMEL